MKKTYSARLTV